ncbi:hypothetical protein V8C34DRAFT_326665 [Trichoderma compactum]
MPLAMHLGESFRRPLDGDSKYDGLWKVTTGAISWAEWLTPFARHPSQPCKGLFKQWKEDLAKDLAGDKAGNINRPDLYRVWGNTLLPCLLGGDDMQLPLTVMTKDEKYEDGHHRNRLGADGTMSALGILQSLPMAKCLFNTCHREVYNDVPFNYGTGSDLGNHATGVNLERYLRARFSKFAPAAARTLSEVFVHCEGTKCLVDEVTHSKRNPDQVLNALDFIADMVKTTRISAAVIAIVTPYAANVELVNRRQMRPEYEALSVMPLATTVDSFRGREADIMVVIMGTTEEVGPGFTTD